MSKESYDSELTKNSFPDLESTFRNLTAEECILYAVGIINQKAGPNDASKLVDLTASLADNDDETFEIVFSQDPVINSINLALDLMARYSILKDWDMVKIIKETTKKNNKNMPEEFFGAFAPFSSVSDTLSCLRLFRKYTFTEEKGIFKKQFSREYFYKMRQLWVIEPLGFQFRLWIAKLIGDIASDQNIPIIDRKLAEKLLERNIETERPLWGQSKHSFELINLDFKHLD
jgi:hypothetical protein